MSAKVLDEGDISKSNVDTFFDTVWELFETTCTYCVKWWPLDDPLYKGSRLVAEQFDKNTILQL